MRYAIIIMILVLTGLTSAWADEVEQAQANLASAKAQISLHRFCHAFVGAIVGTNTSTTADLYASLWLACTHSPKDWLPVATAMTARRNASIAARDAIARAERDVRREEQATAALATTSDPLLDALYLSGAALSGFSTGYLGNAPFGAPNSIGPYGTLGPTWQSFNGYFQPTPQQQQRDMLVH